MIDMEYKKRTTITVVLTIQGMRDSNPHRRFWRPVLYHWTNPLYLIEGIYLQNCTHVTSFFLLLCDQPLSWSWPVPARLPSRLSVKLLSLPLISVFGSSPHFVQWTTFRLRFSLQLRLVFIKSTGQTLDRLVTVSSIHYWTSTSALSTSSSSRGLTSFEWDISSWGGLHA